MLQPAEIAEKKRKLRNVLRKLRSEQQNKESLGEELFQRLLGISQFTAAGTVLYYVDVRDEVRTRAVIEDRLGLSQRVVVPYCMANSLCLVELQSISELVPGTYGILEPNQEIKAECDRSVQPSSVDVALIPGVGFDESGARLGHGKGYYDRLLPLFRTDCWRIGIAFDCQLVKTIPISEFDQRMDLIVTPTRVIDCHRSQ